jgi:phage FluMu protein Com
MQIRCYHCGKPFALGKDTIHAALDLVNAENLSHYDAPCPHCRRVNRVSKEELQRAAPDWQAQSSERSPNG